MTIYNDFPKVREEVDLSTVWTDSNFTYAPLVNQGVDIVYLMVRSYEIWTQQFNGWLNLDIYIVGD